MAFGPLQIFAFAFPTTDKFEGRIAAELVKLSDAGVVQWTEQFGSSSVDRVNDIAVGGGADRVNEVQSRVR